MSSRLMSLNSANALLIVPQGTDSLLEISAGALMDAYLISPS